MKFILIAEQKRAPVAFFPGFKVITLVLVITIVLLVLFPHYLLKKTISYYHQPSQAMLSYLLAFQQVYPKDKQLRLAVIEQEIGLGYLKQAQHELNVLKKMETPASSTMLNQFRWLEYLILRYKTSQAKMNTTKRIAYLGASRQMAMALADLPLPPQQLKILAQDNLSLARASVALKIYKNLLDMHALTTVAEIAAGGSIAMQNSAHTESAKFYWIAFEKATTLHEKRQYAMNALKALWAGNLLEQALSLGEKLPPAVVNNRALLVYLARLAIAANHPEIAQNYALKALRKISEKQKLLSFDNEVYQLAYQTLLYNSNISMAYALARIALYHQPQSIIWHEKMAQAATWVGDYNTAMSQWLYVVNHTKNTPLMEKAISIAKAFGYDEVLEQLIDRYLKQSPDNPEALLVLAETENKLYQPVKALQTLQKLNQHYPSRRADVLSATIYEDMGQWEKALTTWRKVNRYAPDVHSIMAEANIYYTSGQFKQAVTILEQAIPLAKSQDIAFWDTLADLAWYINNKRLAVLGYSHNLNNTFHLSNLIQLEILSHPQQALRYSIKGWSNFHTMLFFLNALTLADQLNQWPVIDQLLTHLSTEELKEVEKTQAFWQAQANLYKAFSEKQLQQNVLAKAVMLHPEFTQLKSDLLWLLMTNGESQWVRGLLEEWKYSMNDALLWHAFAEGYDVQNQFMAAIEMYQTHLFEHIQEDQVLIDYASLLEKALFHQEAYSVREFVWHRALQRFNQQNARDNETLETLSQLSPFYVSGTLQSQFLNALLNNEPNDHDQSINIALNWMIEKNDIDLIAFFKAYYLQNGLPYKPDIILALAKNDLTALQKFMEQPEQPFLRSERINAAVRLENTPLAEQIAFNELTDRPLAHEIYTEFSLYGIKDASFVRVAEEYEQFINLVGARTLFEGKSRLTNKWKIRPYLKRWDVKSNSSQFLVNVPAQDLEAGFKLEEKIHRGLLTYTLGYRDALSAFAPLDIDLNYLLASRWSANVHAGFNQEVYQTAYMRIGGVQDQLNVTLFYNPEKYDFLQVGIEGLNYYSQDRHYLANGFNLHGLYEHKLWLSYPDYTVGLFSDLYQFNRNGTYGGNITTLFPQISPSEVANPSVSASIQSANYQQIIPNTYAQGGFIFNFGSAILDYTHAWRPYLSASIYYNTYVGIANDVKIGLNGTVFGRDSLLFYAERGTAQAVANSLTYKFGARYSIYL